MKIILLISFIFITSKLTAQDCNCEANFNYTLEKVTNNYAGYNDKITTKNNVEFKDFTAKLFQRAKQTTNMDSCYVLLRTWTNYFKDQHLRVQLDWRYREKYPEKQAQLSKLFSKRNTLSAPAKDILEDKASIKQLSDNTLLITLPSFEYAEKKNLDSLLQKFEAELRSKQNWIIDIRGNMGGTDFAFSSILPYIYTNPMATLTSEYLATKDNIAIYEEQLADKNLNEDTRFYINNIVILMKKSLGKFVNPAGRDTVLTTLDNIKEYPKNVGIMIDRNSASSAESFLLLAKQSKKVIIYGENSYGMLDYANYQYFDIPCNAYNLTIPISRSTRLPKNPIDNIGITPDVMIDNNEKDKVKFIQTRLEQIK